MWQEQAEQARLSVSLVKLIVMVWSRYGPHLLGWLLGQDHSLARLSTARLTSKLAALLLVFLHVSI
jgi:hypothetical protein